MVTVTLQVDLRLLGAPHSLKEKRMIVRSLKDRIRSRFAVAIAEVGGEDLWQRTILGVAAVSNEKNQAQSVIYKILHFIESSGKVEVVDSQVETY